MSKLTLFDCLKPADNTAHETVEDQTVIINLETGVYFSLNATGSFLWERMDGETPLNTISTELAETFSVTSEQTDPDVLELAEQLVAEGIAVKV